ncbi:hypothetical protein JCM19274_933 [Algibacter lectus]|uniref:Uncharacterized protein n=1 Tax=Algibacter lectus TaxID=221126 RepID=A0A090WSY4_9FLAO|nr:hypothetical protein JCM19274_933 [Algibacter lectus]
MFLLVSSFSFSQTGQIVKTEDGRRVFLKNDYTWEYLDAVDSESQTALIESLKSADENVCSLEAGYLEPRLDGKIQSQLKRGRSSMRYVKKKVAKDQNCSVDDVFYCLFLSKKRKRFIIFVQMELR